LSGFFIRKDKCKVIALVFQSTTFCTKALKNRPSKTDDGDKDERGALDQASKQVQT
jgi:hypothetical protein